ncbi:MAG: DNA-directed RNA polymerase subunit delta [Bacilli bacterium]
MRKRTNIEIAYALLKENTEKVGISFFDLWQHVVNENEYTEEEGHEMVSKFYTALMMDGRFVNTGDNTWQLRERMLFDEIALPLNEVYTDDDELSEDDDDAPEIIYFDDENTEENPEGKIKEIISGEED